MPGGHRSRHDHCVNGELHQPVGAREGFIRKDLGQDSLFCRVEEAGVNPQQEKHRQHGDDMAHEHGEGGHHQQRGLNPLHENDHAALGEMVGHLAGIGGQHDVRQHVERGAKGNVKVASGERSDTGGDEEHQELLESVVIKHRQRLRRQQVDKSPLFQNARITSRSCHLPCLRRLCRPAARKGFAFPGQHHPGPQGASPPHRRRGAFAGTPLLIEEGWRGSAGVVTSKPLFSWQ